MRLLQEKVKKKSKRSRRLWTLKNQEAVKKAAGEARDGGIYSFHRSNRSSNRYIAAKTSTVFYGEMCVGTWRRDVPTVT